MNDDGAQFYFDSFCANDSEPQSRPAGVFTSNNNRSCADMVSLIASERLCIQPTFQRELVWGAEAKTRFLDTLLKEIPVPSIMFSFDKADGKQYVIDGLQRLSTVFEILRPDPERDLQLAKLSDIDPILSGASLNQLRKTHPGLFERIALVQIPMTLVTYDSRVPEECEFIFTIFHRINSGGIKLNNQEIRNAIYQGAINDCIRQCDSLLGWRLLTGRMPEESGDRFLHRELVLRVFAFTDELDRYNSGLTGFLNRYMSRKRNIPSMEVHAKVRAFDAAVDLISTRMLAGGKAPRDAALSNVKLEALVYGVMANLDTLSERPAEELQQLYRKWIVGAPFSPARMKDKLYGKERVLERLAFTKNIFSRNSATMPLAPVQTDLAGIA